MSFYQPPIPQPNDFISISQSDIQQNFEETNNYVNKNHEPFNSEKYGKHKFTTLVKQTVVPTTALDEIALVNLDGFPISPTPELFFRAENKAPGDPSTRLTPRPGIAGRFIMEFDKKGNPIFRNSYNIKGFELLHEDQPLPEALEVADQYYVKFRRELQSKFYIPMIISQTKDTLLPGQSMFASISQQSTKGFILEFVFKLVTTGSPKKPTLQKTTVTIFGDIPDEE